MEVARHVFDTYFRDTLNPMVRHHLDSQGDLLRTQIPRFIKATNPITRLLKDEREFRVWIGGHDGTSIRYLPPADEFGNATLPHECRLRDQTYAFTLVADVDIDYIVDGDTITKSFKDVKIGRIPLMLKSPLCYLATMNSEQLFQAGECKFELGGYFIINGVERLLLTQERRGTNIQQSDKVKVPSGGSDGAPSLQEKEKEKDIEGRTRGEDQEQIAGIRSGSEDGTRGPQTHEVRIPSKPRDMTDPKEIAKESDQAAFLTKRLAKVSIPGFENPVPLFSLFAALGFTTAQDVYDVTLCGVTESERTQQDSLFAVLKLTHEKFVAQEMAKEEDQTQDPNLLFLRQQVRSRSLGGVYKRLYEQLFPHCEPREGESAASLQRRKGQVLGILFRMAMEVALDIRPPSDRDHYRFKRLDASGELCFDEFRRIYKELKDRILLEMESKIEYEGKIYAGRKIAEIIPADRIDKFWRYLEFQNQFEKSFKSAWGKSGQQCAQVMTRLSGASYLGTIAQLRRVSIQMNHETSKREPRRIHASSFGLMCPIDNPDGRPIGMVKSMSLFCRLSTQSSASEIREMLAKESHFVPIERIHPSTWDPVWTRIFLNGEPVGVNQKDSEAMHQNFLNARRTQKIDPFVSLYWNRLENEYHICTDAGRPCRPLYREGVTPEQIKRTSAWKTMMEKQMDQIDAQEVECLRVSLVPFHPSQPSEIHGSTVFSASGSVLPITEFNPATRNTFSCQQSKQAVSMQNTAFSKRFDTISAILNSPQRPLAQTWTTNAVLGGNGCLPYGENAILAIAVQTGYNQDDSVLMNASAVNRGLFRTTYFHSSSVEETMINAEIQLHTIIANPLTNPKYHSVALKKKQDQPDKDFSKLDSDGIVQVGSQVDDNTVIVGMVTPVTNNGKIVDFRDSSVTPKRGHHGRVDAVYRFRTPVIKRPDGTTTGGLMGVKIRLAEERLPILGDKFAARHGQKGTCGALLAEEDMPYTASGMRPDVVLNPHAFPSRMTIGQFVEMMSTKVGMTLGTLIDCNSYSTQNRMVEVKEILTQLGFNPQGHEVMYNGMTGEMMESDIFMGPAYYLRMKQMTEDKINYRTTGPRNNTTHQPVEGRANGGGLRIGEMERDSLLSHGISAFLQESLMKRSDGETFLFQPDTGRLDANIDLPTTQVEMPYSMRLFLQEMEAMHLQVKMASE